MYKEFIHPQTNEVSAIIRENDEAFIPCDPQNTDYQTYLQWLSEGNEPEIINMD